MKRCVRMHEEKHERVWRNKGRRGEGNGNRKKGRERRKGRMMGKGGEMEKARKGEK